MITNLYKIQTMPERVEGNHSARSDFFDFAYFMTVVLPTGIILFPGYFSEILHDSGHPKAAKIAAGVTGLIDGGVVGGVVLSEARPEIVAISVLSVMGATGLCSVFGAIMESYSSLISESELKYRPKSRLNIPLKNFLRIHD